MKMPPLLFEEFQARKVTAPEMDALWAKGWRHFGPEFFRYNVSIDATGLRQIQPLRIAVAQFNPSKSQRRVLRKNAHLKVRVRPARITDELAEMFNRHKQRFTSNIPDGLHNFISPDPASSPCATWQFGVYHEDKLIAASYLDLGATAASSVYGMFDPDFSSLSLGIFTMLVELEWASARGLQYYYPGYATVEKGHYDYKKLFSALEDYQWEQEAWRSLSKVSEED